MNNNRIECADGIRGLALLNVVILHATGLFFPNTGPFLKGTAQWGVWIFFVLSAFLLSYRFMVTGFGVKSILSYALGRTLRIIPLFFFCAYAYYLAGLFNYEKLTGILKFNETYAHFWTIPVEFGFYFILPVISYVLIKGFSYKGAWMAVILAAMMVVIHQSLFPMYDKSMMFTMKWYIPTFIYGIVISILYKNRVYKSTLLNSDVIFIIFVLMCFCLSPYPMHYLFDGDYSDWLYNKFPVFGIAVSVLVYSIIDGGGVIGWILKSKLMRYLGKWSFSIYLWHLLIFFRVAPFNHNNIVIFVVTIISAIGFGAISYHSIEEPCEKIRHKIMAKIYAD